MARATLARFALAVWLTSAALSLASPALAALPATILFEGALLGAGGTPASDGGYQLTFALYADAQGGSALWSESGVSVTVAKGAFVHALGSKVSLDAASLAQARWLAVQVAKEPELPRVALHAVAFAGRAAVAEALDCSGCLSVGALKFDGDVDLGGHSLKAKNATFTGDVYAKAVVAATLAGDGSKITGLAIPTGACPAGKVVSGIAADGSLVCVAGASGLLGGKLTDSMIESGSAGSLPVAIPDNTGTEAIGQVSFGKVGAVNGISVHIKVSNTDLSQVRLVLLPPDDKAKGLTVCDPCGGTGEKSYDKTLTAATPLKVGSLGGYEGKDLQGLWTVKVLDTAFCIPQAPGNQGICDPAKGTDGKLDAFTVSGTVQSELSVRTTGTFQFGMFDTQPFLCTPSKRGHAYFENPTGQLLLCDGTAWRQVLTQSLCGNKIVNGGEQCDDGNSDDSDGCTNGCKNNICGDGKLHVGVEQCDDGNQIDDDMCNNACKAKFQLVTFTTCGAAGRTGPSQNACDSAYANTPLAGKVTLVGGVQQWTVPATGSYVLEAFGARGGAAPGQTGGSGARMRGRFDLTQGQVLWIVVGHEGGGSQSAGGGGGTFVGVGATLANATPLIVAGGGGGGRSSNYVGNGRPGVTGTAGTSGKYAGGTNGNGGARQNGPCGGFAGGGYYTEGQQGGGGGTSGSAFVKGAAGGLRQDNGANLCADGGFGGGGGGMHNCNQGSGGGGGYSGGGAGHDDSGPGYGGGGGSFNGGSNQDYTEGANAAAGKLVITAG